VANTLRPGLVVGVASVEVYPHTGVASQKIVWGQIFWF